MEFGLIYKVTNILNGKIYIGQTTQDFNSRINQHIRDSRKNKNHPFHNALKKYGKDSFSWEVLEYVFNREELNEKEIFWISHYNSYIHSENSNGYNLTLGGDGISGFKHREESKQRMSENHADFSGQNHPLFGIGHKDSSRLKMSESKKGMYKGDKHPLFGIGHTEESIEKMREAQKGEKHWRATKVVQLTLSNEYIATHNTVRTASKTINKSHQSISACCRGKQKTAYGFIWMYEEDYIQKLQE